MVAAAAAARIAPAAERLGSGSDTACAGITRLAGVPVRSQRACAFGLQRRTTPKARPPDRNDPGNGLSPQLRRQHVYAAETAAYQALSPDDSR